MKRLFIIGFLLMTSSLTVEAQFTNSGNMKIFSGASVAFFGNVANNGTIIDEGTLVTFAGSAAQTVSGSSVTTFNNLKLNNSSSTGVTLSQAMNVGGAMTFTDGYLYSTAVNILTLTNTASVTGATNNSFVSGPMAKIGNQAFVFPVGKNVVYAPISMSAPAVNTDNFTAEYFQTSPHPTYNTLSKEATLHHLAQCEYWTLDRTAGSSNVSVTLSWDTRSCGVTVLNDLRVARWDGAQWTDKGNGGTTGTTTAGTIVSSGGVTGFGPFTLASVSGSNPLPVELLGFSGNCENDRPVLRWSTESEIQNDYFTIESSIDATAWESVGTIDGAGNSTALLDYDYTDLSNPGRDLYYRLKQTDLDGTTTTFDIVFVESCLQASEEVTVYPNPSKDRVTILSESEIQHVSVIDPEGKETGVDVDLVNKHIDFSQVPQGVYFIKITTSEGIFNQRIVISGR